MNQTEHSKYNLPSELDEIKTSDYNENFQKIDTEIFDITETARAAKNTAEQAMEQVEAAGGSVMTDTTLGVGKVDGETVLVDKAGTLSVPVATNEQTGLVKPDGVTLNVVDSLLKLIANATNIPAEDKSGLLMDSENKSVQALIDVLADRVATKLIDKAMMSSVQVNDSGKVPTSALAYAMQQSITQNANAITQLNSDSIKHMKTSSKEYNSLPANDTESCFFYNSKSMVFGSYNVPAWSIGIMQLGAADGMCLITDRKGNLYTAFRISNVWQSFSQVALKPELDNIAKIDRSTSSVWIGDKNRNMIFNCNFNNKTLIVTFADGKTVTFNGQ